VTDLLENSGMRGLSTKQCDVVVYWLWVQCLAVTLSFNDSRQVVCTFVPVSPSGIIRDVRPWLWPGLKNAGRGLGLGTPGLALALALLTLRPNPGQTQCHCFIIIRINADEFDPDLFQLCILNEQLLLLKPLLESVFCVPASSAPVQHFFIKWIHHVATSCLHV